MNALTGYSGTGGGPASTSYSVHDRLYNGRIVGHFYSRERANGLTFTDVSRKRAAEALAARLNMEEAEDAA